MNYEKTGFFKRLEKIAELEKRVSGFIESAKAQSGDLDISDLVSGPKEGLTGLSQEKTVLPGMIMRAILAKRNPVPSSVLNECIDDGLEATTAHVAKHNIAMSPSDAAYIAIGKKDEGIREALSKVTLANILDMISNKAAVSQYSPDAPMRLDDFDQPRHVRMMIRLKGMSPGELGKTARSKNPLDDSSMFDTVEFTLSNGTKMKKGRDEAREDKASLQRLINDGIIIKIIKIMSSGQKTTIYEKNASEASVDDILSVMTYA